MNQDYKEWFTEHGFAEQVPAFANADGDYALILASRQGRCDLVQQLLADGASSDCTDRYGNNALWAACYADSEGCARLLAQNGCALDYQNPAGNSALAYAASSGRDKMVKLLLELGANPNLQNQDGMTAMDLASTLTGLKLLRKACSK